MEYLIPTTRPFASDIEFSTFHGVTTIVLDGDTGHTTLKHISQICWARLQVLVNIHSGDRGREVLLAGGSISDDYKLL